MTRLRFSKGLQPTAAWTMLLGLVLFGHLACSEGMPAGEPESSSVVGESEAEPEEVQAVDVVVDSTVDEERACGGIAGAPCSGEEFCEFQVGMCDDADLDGVCVERPEICPEIFEPICGCDGRTYSNDCFRLMASVQLDHDGECEAS